MSESSPDPWLEQQLRDVPLPDGLQDRLRDVAGWGNSQIDAALSQVPIAAGLRERLRGIVRDEQVDQRLRDVPLPASLLPRLHAIARQGRRWAAWGRLSAAAVLLAAASVAYLAILAGWTYPSYRRATGGGAALSLEMSASFARPGTPDLPAVELALEPARSDQRVDLPRIEPLVLPVPADGPLSELQSQLAWAPNLLDDIYRLRWGHLSLPHGDDETLGDPREPARLRTRYPSAAARVLDPRFLMAHQASPVISPRHPGQPHTATVPMVTETESYDLLCRVLDQGRLPAPSQVRVEDFLAAVWFPFPAPPPGKVGLRTAAGPSIFGDGRAGLLQVAVNAGPPAADRRPTHLTIAVDVSASMGWGDRLWMTAQALQRLPAQLTDQDHLSLVAINETARVLVEHAPIDQPDRWRRVLAEGLQPRGSSNLGAGLQRAAAIADGPGSRPGAARQLVVVTDRVIGLPESIAFQLEQLLTELGRSGVQVRFVQWGSEDEADPLLSRFAFASGGSLDHVQTVEQLRGILASALAPGPAAEVCDAQLRVTFNPRAVTAYRLLGHDALSLGTVAGSVESVLHAGQQASALFEVWLEPNGADERIALAEVMWREGPGGPARRVEQRVGRLQFATSLGAMPLPLEAAALAAEAAEVLRGSPFVQPGARRLQHVLLAAAEVHPRLAGQPAWREFVTTLQRADALLERVPAAVRRP